jgi:hypothetical protein
MFCCSNPCSDIDEGVRVVVQVATGLREPADLHFLCSWPLKTSQVIELESIVACAAARSDGSDSHFDVTQRQNHIRQQRQSKNVIRLTSDATSPVGVFNQCPTEGNRVADAIVTTPSAGFVCKLKTTARNRLPLNGLRRFARPTIAMVTESVSLRGSLAYRNRTSL